MTPFCILCFFSIVSTAIATTASVAFFTTMTGHTTVTLFLHKAIKKSVVVSKKTRSIGIRRIKTIGIVIGERSVKTTPKWVVKGIVSSPSPIRITTVSPSVVTPPRVVKAPKIKPIPSPSRTKKIRIQRTVVDHVNLRAIWLRPPRLVVDLSTAISVYINKNFIGRRGRYVLVAKVLKVILIIVTTLLILPRSLLILICFRHTRSWCPICCCCWVLSGCWITVVNPIRIIIRNSLKRTTLKRDSCNQ